MKTVSFMLSVSLVLVATAQEAPTPKIVVPEPTWNFGEQVNTQILEHVFVIRNEGTATLEITRTRPTCGCTVAQVSKNQLEPGAEATLTARLDLRGRTGLQLKQIHVDSNDPSQPTITLTMTGQAIPDLQISPPSIFLGQLGRESAVTAYVDIVAAPEKGLRLERLAVDTPSLQADLEVIEEGRRYRAVIRTIPPLSPGSFAWRVMGVPNLPDGSTLTIPVACTVGGGLIVAPTEVVLGVGEPEPTMRHIVLHASDDQAFTLEGIEVPMIASYIQASFSPMGQRGYRIQLENLRADPALNGQELRIRTSRADTPVVVIPFRIRTPSP